MNERPIRRVHLTSDFKKSFRKLPPHIQRLASKKDKRFRANAHDPGLKTHRLHGRLLGFWAYSVNHQYRVLFQFTKPDQVIYHDIGTHSIYK